MKIRHKREARAMPVGEENPSKTHEISENDVGEFHNEEGPGSTCNIDGKEIESYDLGGKNFFTRISSLLKKLI